MTPLRTCSEATADSLFRHRQTVPGAALDVTAVGGFRRRPVRPAKAGIMETIIGFAAGYVVGAQDGRPGLNRLRHAMQAIAKSPEARKLAAEAVTIAGH